MSRKNDNKQECEEKTNEDDVIVVCDESDDDGTWRDEVSAHKRRAEEMVYQAQRLQAEFDNYRKRTTESLKAVKEDGRAEVIERLLPALDAFSQAAAIIKDKSILDGVNMIFKRLFECLSGFGLAKIESLDAEFDPNFHNALTVREDERVGKVIEVLQDGYTLNGKVLRAATVIIGGKS